MGRLVEMTRPLWIILLVAGAAACSSGGSGDGAEVNVSVSSLSTAVADASAGSTGRVSAPEVKAVGDSKALPVIDGMKISIVTGIDLCTGVYGEESEDCSATVLRLDDPAEVELTQSAGASVDLAAVGTALSVAEGEYTHARVGIARAFSLKAYFHSGSDTIYTSAGGLKTNTASTEPGDDYDYLAYDDLYPTLVPDSQQPDRAQEVTYFSVPFSYDGSSAIDLKMLVDIRRSGAFVVSGEESDEEADFIATYPNVYMTFNESGVSDVETYVLSGTSEGLLEDTSTVLTLLFTESGTLIGARTRYFDNMSAPPVGKIGQFLKDWECTGSGESESCTFLAGDYGGNEFPQTGTGFARQEVGDAAASFSLTSTEVEGTSTIYYQRVSE